MVETILATAAAATDTMTVTLTPQMLATIPLLAVAMQFIKGFQPLAKYSAWFPMLSLLLAIGAAVAMGMGDDLQARVMSGIIMGLATSGGYDAAKVPTKIADNKFAATIVSVTETEVPAAADRAQP